MDKGDIVFVMICYWSTDMLSMCHIIIITVIIFFVNNYNVLLPNHIPGPLMFYIRQSIVAYGHTNSRHVLTLHNRVAVLQSTDKY